MVNCEFCVLSQVMSWGVGDLFIELFRMDCVYLGQKVCVIRFFFFFLKVSVYAYSNFKTTT